MFLLAALGVLSDVTREIGLKILPHCDQLMTLLLQLLQKDDVRREVKPQILSAVRGANRRGRPIA